MPAHDMVEGDGTAPSLLCLKCRQVGHNVEKCPAPWGEDEYGWFFSPKRRLMDFGNTSTSSAPDFCRRCRDLNLLHFLRQDIPWSSRDDLEQETFHWSKFARSLGQTGSIEFRHDCPLCRCLFALTPTPSSTTQEILMLPNWSMNRLEGGIFMDTSEKRRYAKCLLVALHPSSYGLPFSDRAQRGDALCIVEEDDGDQATTLGGRRIDSDHLCTDTIEEWLSSCDVRHPDSCKPVWTQELEEIRLVDVLSRKIVKYPERGCEYLALSYVWGNVAQQRFHLGDTLGELPQTIEDTIALVRELKKQYLWVDSVCIDQGSKADRTHQIKRMSFIYRGSYATVIALSGESARSGLPRLGANKRRQPQITCSIDGKCLVGLMPTLSQQVWSSPWGSRAWTLQEGLLSPRCLYISDHQIYFECNAMQCSESLDESRSWVHQLYRNAESARKNWSEAEIGGGVLRNPLVGLSGLKNNRLVQYGSGLCLYSYRSMTDPKDALNAFSAILQYLEKDYTEGFFVGLPVEDFQWGLLWRSQSPPRRRKGFPSWSWTGWEGALWPGYPHDLYKPQAFQPHLQIWKAAKNQLVQLFKAPPDTDDMEATNVFFRNDPISTAARSDFHGPDFDVNKYAQAEEDGCIFVEAVALSFIPDYSRPLGKVRQKGKLETFAMLVAGVACAIEIMSTDGELSQPARRTEQEFLVLARDRRRGGWVSYHLLLLLDVRGGTAERRTTLSLLVPEDHLEAVEALRPRKRRVVLS